MVVTETISGLSALKVAFDMAKALKDINDATIRNGAIIDLQENIISAQQAQAALIKRVDELEKEVAGFEAWETEKQRYELNDVGLGSLAYSVKEGMRGTEPPHQICTACYQHRRKSILQPKSESLDKLLICPECKTKIKIGNLQLDGGRIMI
jgi:Zn finger protein HypA/HybF involved in hydrogenase expression